MVPQGLVPGPPQVPKSTDAQVPYKNGEVQAALCVGGFHICGFNQQRFEIRAWGTRGYRGPTVIQG